MIAINEVANVAESLGGDFEDGFNVVVMGLTQFGDDISSAFQNAGNEILGGL
jgi:phage-related protein